MMTWLSVGPGTGARQHDNIDSDVEAAADASAQIVAITSLGFIHSFLIEKGKFSTGTRSTLLAALLHSE